MSLPEDANSVVILSQSLLTTISEITTSVEDIKIEHENFMEFGCYLERVSSAIMELQITKNTPQNATEILHQLSKNVDLAKDLVGQCSTEATSISDLEVKNIMKQLEKLIRNMGEGLSLIPSSTFEKHEYAEVAVRSLSKEMKNAQFEVNAIPSSSPLEPARQKLKNQCPEIFLEKEQNSSRIEESEENPRLLVSRSQSQVMPQLGDFIQRLNYSEREKQEKSSISSKSLPKVAEYMEPLYETFICPLTKKIMNDPVTIDSGQTYERKAITEWFKKFKDGEDDPVCPSTGTKLRCRDITSNLALKVTIDEWKERNEATRIKIARTALSLASSDGMIIEALKDLQCLCKRKRYNKVQICTIGIVPLLIKLLEYNEMKVRCETLQTLFLLAEEEQDEEFQEMIAQSKAIPTTIKMLSSNYPQEQHAAVTFLLELSKSEYLSERIGSVTGGILLLITMKYNVSADAVAAEKADKTLRNLEKYPGNIRNMAENGLLDPLLNHLIEGSEEMQTEMGNYLGEIVLGHESKIYVAERAATALIKMVHSGNTLTRKAAFKALVQISSYHPNSKILIDAGIIPIMIEEMVTRQIDNEPMNSKEESATILANILESGFDFETLRVNSHGHTMASDYIIYHIIHNLKNSMPELKNLMKILLCLSNSPKAMGSVVSVIKETDATYTLMELIDYPDEEISIASMKLLILLCNHVGHTLAERLCKTRGQPENLVKKLETRLITEKQSVSANLLAKLPYQNLNLNLTLVDKNTVPIVIQRINEIQRGEARTSRFLCSYLEGLVGILVRFTSTLYDDQILSIARTHNLTAVFTELLMRTGTDEVQRLSAIGLENLSSESVNLSKIPRNQKPKFNRIIPGCFRPTQRKIKLCPIHRGACSSQTTFCLLDARALEKILACLDHQNVGVVEAALSALCTLLDDKVDVDKSMSVLSEVNAVQHVLNVLREHTEEAVWQKSFWVIERFLKKGDGFSSDISEDRSLPSTLVSAFHHGDSSTRQMAEKILRHLNKMPNFSSKIIL